VSERILTRYPSIETPEQARDRKESLPTREYDIDNFEALELRADELHGTEWRNIHTIQLGVAGETNDFDRVCDPRHPALKLQLGFEGIAHCVRVDHLSSEIRRRWHLSRIEVCFEELAKKQKCLDRLKAKPKSEVSCKAANVRIQKNCVEARRADLEEARDELRTVDHEHRFSTRPRDLNHGAPGGVQGRLI
jgi:hypothetical protein